MANFDFGKFLEVLGRGGVGFGQQITQRNKEKKQAQARKPYDDLNLKLLKQQAEKGQLGIDEDKAKVARDKTKREKLKVFQKLLTDKDVTEEVQSIILSQKNLGGQQGQPGLEGPERQQATIQTQTTPTPQQQLQRVEESEFAFSPDPEIRSQVEGLRKRVEEPDRRMQEFEQKEDIKQEHDIEMQGIKGEQALEMKKLGTIEKAQLKQMKDDEKAKKRSDEQKDINAGIEAVLTLSQGVKPHGRILGIIEKVGKWSGFNPNLSSLDNTAGLLAGQVAKKIGGESGRLTDQDRIYALRVMPKSTDTKAERKIKVAVLKTFQDPNVSAESIRQKLIQAMSGLSKMDREKYQLLDEEGNPLSEEESSLPEDIKTTDFRKKYNY